MAASGPLLGYANHLYYNTGSYGFPTWVLITNVANAKVSLEANEAEATTRAGAGFNIKEPGLFDLSVEFDAIYDATDTVLMAIRAAALARTPIEIFALDGLVVTTGSLGVRFIGKFFGFSKDESLGEMTKVTPLKIVPCLSATAPASCTVA